MNLNSIFFGRYNGRKILYILMAHQDFDKMLSKHLPSNTLRNIQEIVEGLKTKVYLTLQSSYNLDILFQ